MSPSIKSVVRRSQPSLSFEKQPALKELITELVSGTDSLTIFCGAGASVDSGLPTWKGLLEDLAGTIKHEGIRKLLLSEPDIMRSAEFVLDQTGSQVGDDHKVAQALYSRATSSAGQLATSIAKLCALLGSRVKIITTNYDDRLELALSAELGGTDGIQVYGMDESAAWVADSSGIAILHVHGFIPSAELEKVFPPKRPIILTEGQYLQHGSQVQEIVHERLVESRMIFIGASMSDSSVVSPLSEWFGGGKIKRAFALLAPDIASASLATDGNVESLALEYLAEFSRYLTKSLQTEVIELKSFGQVAQCVGEMSAALQTGAAYLADDATTSPRYGFRFQRVLGEVHQRVGIWEGRVAPGGADAQRLSEALFTALEAEDGPASFIANARLELDYERLNVSDDYFDSECFGLELWLRTMLVAPQPPRYEVILAGSSGYARRHGDVLTSRSSISPYSLYAAARSIYKGGAFGATERATPPSSSAGTEAWLTYFAVPLTIDEATVGLTQTTEQRVTIGAVVLQSNRRRTDGSIRGSGRERMSVLSEIGADAERDLNELIHRAGVEAITS